MFYATERAETKIPLIIKSSKHKKNEKKRKEKKKNRQLQRTDPEKAFSNSKFPLQEFCREQRKSVFPVRSLLFKEREEKRARSTDTESVFSGENPLEQMKHSNYRMKSKAAG